MTDPDQRGHDSEPLKQTQTWNESQSGSYDAEDGDDLGAGFQGETAAGFQTETHPGFWNRWIWWKEQNSHLYSSNAEWDSPTILLLLVLWCLLLFYVNVRSNQPAHLKRPKWNSSFQVLFGFVVLVLLQDTHGRLRRTEKRFWLQLAHTKYK